MTETKERQGFQELIKPAGYDRRKKEGGSRRWDIVIVMFVIRFLVEFNKCVGKRKRKGERGEKRWWVC